MYNSNSITRKNHHEYLFNGLFGYIYNITWALTIAIRANCDNQKISELTFATLITIYYYYIMFLDNPNVNRLLEDSKDFYQISLNYPLDSDETKSNLWQKQFNAIAKDINIEDRLNPPISLNEFFMKISLKRRFSLGKWKLYRQEPGARDFDSGQGTKNTGHHRNTAGDVPCAYRWSPIKNRARVPGPEWEPMTAPT